MTEKIRVFISYSHDNDTHKQCVRELAEQFRAAGFDAWIDQYESGPAEGWFRWTQNEMDKAAWVVLVCTEPYKRFFEGALDGTRGRGVNLEGLLACTDLYKAGMINNKFIPIRFEGEPESSIPDVLFAYSHYEWPVGRDLLYGHFRKLPPVQPPPLP